MNNKIKSLLLPFYFGSIGDDHRIMVEQQLLVDSEVLLDYLDLKRSLEAAPVIPNEPSVAVWAKLRERVVQRKPLFISLSFGAAAVFVLIVSVLIFKSGPADAPTLETKTSEVLFDSLNELPANSNVL